MHFFKSHLEKAKGYSFVGIIGMLPPLLTVQPSKLAWLAGNPKTSGLQPNVFLYVAIYTCQKHP
jgi:hypothetical protein